MIKIELDLEDTELFKEFRKYQDQFKKLLEAGIFSDYVGSKTIHKDGKEIRMIEDKFVRKF